MKNSNSIYEGIFANRIPYKNRPVKELLPTVSKLGIMSKPGNITAIAGSINFARDIDASRPSSSTAYQKPARWAADTEVETTALPKEARSQRLEYDFDKVTIQRGKDSYKKEDLIYWYNRLTGLEVPSNFSRPHLEQLHAELDINRGKK